MHILRAPDFPKGFTWLNTPTPLSFHGNLKGQVVLLDFWTYCCINCMHVLPDLETLHARYKNDPFVIIGVHTAKHPNESAPENVRAAIARYTISHPVIVDEDMRLWQEYAIRAWPSLVLVGADGRIVGGVSGEGHLNLLINAIDKALADARAANTLASAPLHLPADTAPPSASPLSFPSRMIPDPARNRLFILDANHNRILITSLPTNDHRLTLTAIIGAGTPGHADGPFATAQFHRPQGAAVDPSGKALWVADTENHLIRRVDLEQQTVSTILGTGTQKFDSEPAKSGRQQPLNSPWDLAIGPATPGGPPRLLIAMAGQHQLWAMNMMTATPEVLAGTGGENLRDGPADDAALAQPSALALDPLANRLYFADAETSAIRYLDLAAKTVHTLVGTGLFDFGDRDGPAPTARLQHPLGLALSPDRTTLLIADTYNHKIKRLHLPTQTLETLPTNLPLAEPSAIIPLNDLLLLTDTNNHRLLTHNPTTGECHELALVSEGTQQKL